jgi:hypothetical protein
MSNRRKEIDRFHKFNLQTELKLGISIRGIPSISRIEGRFGNAQPEPKVKSLNKFKNKAVFAL